MKPRIMMKTLMITLSLVTLFTIGSIPGELVTPNLMPTVWAQEAASERPLEDFLSTQGTYCVDDGEGGCVIFVPPIANFIGWGDPASNLFVSVDYAGLADAWIKEESDGAVSFGTRMDGAVTERALEDGRAEVTVVLHTRNALTWVLVGDEEGNPDFANAPLLLGHRAPEVLAESKEAVLGESFLQLTFINPAPGAPLPDFLQLFIAPEEGQEFVSVTFHAHAEGPLREASGLGEGTPGQMTVTQIGDTVSFPVERVTLSGVEP